MDAHIVRGPPEKEGTEFISRKLWMFKLAGAQGMTFCVFSECTGRGETTRCACVCVMFFFFFSCVFCDVFFFLLLLFLFVFLLSVVIPTHSLPETPNASGFDSLA